MNIFSGLRMRDLQSGSFVTPTNNETSIKTEADTPDWARHVDQSALTYPVGCIPEGYYRI